MRILIVEGSVGECGGAVQQLRAAGADVAVAADVEMALALATQTSWGVIVLDAGLAGPSLRSLISKVRACEGARSFLIVASSAMSIAEMNTALDAGADDYVRRPIDHAELLAQLTILEQMRAVTERVLTNSTMPSTAIRVPSRLRVLHLKAWQVADRSIQHDIGEMLGHSLERTGDSSFSAGVVAAQVPITVAAERAEVRLTVGVSASMVPRLCELCLGDAEASEDALRDVLRELANTAGGAFVRAADEEGVVLTHGLPVDVPRLSLRPRAWSCQHFALRSEDGAFCVHFELELLGRALSHVSVSDLSEGMVLARELRSDAGEVLVESGARLTSSQIDRVRGVLSSTLACVVVDSRMTQSQ